MLQAVCILKAFLVTDNALVNCLNQFIGTVKDPVKKEITIKEENWPIIFLYIYTSGVIAVTAWQDLIY